MLTDLPNYSNLVKRLLQQSLESQLDVMMLTLNGRLITVTSMASGDTCRSCSVW